MCDDNIMEYKILQKALQVADIPAECAYYPCAEDLLNDYHTDRFDLVLLDIYMEGIGGISAAEQLRNADQMVPIAFITSSPDHTMDGFRLHIDRYDVFPHFYPVRRLLFSAQIYKKNRRCAPASH